MVLMRKDIIMANGIASHAEGYGTVTNNVAEHACGRYNESSQGDTEADNTIFLSWYW